MQLVLLMLLIVCMQTDHGHSLLTHHTYRTWVQCSLVEIASSAAVCARCVCRQPAVQHGWWAEWGQTWLLLLPALLTKCAHSAGATEAAVYCQSQYIPKSGMQVLPALVQDCIHLVGPLPNIVPAQKSDAKFMSSQQYSCHWKWQQHNLVWPLPKCISRHCKVPAFESGPLQVNVLQCVWIALASTIPDHTDWWRDTDNELLPISWGQQMLWGWAVSPS